MNGTALYADTSGTGQESLVERYAELVGRIARHLMGRLPDSVQWDDLVQAGMIGLLEAARNFDQSQGASFETYAGIRIRGAMLDEVRRNDWVPRSVHRKSREVSRAIKSVEDREGREARSDEVARELGVSVENYHKLIHDARGQKLFSMEELGSDEESWVDHLPAQEPGPLAALQRDDYLGRLSELIAELPERERLVMSLYYDEELNLREIGEVLGVTESRVCQIHGKALLRLKARLDT